MFTDPFGLERTLVDRETSLISVDESTCNEDLARLISDRLMNVSLGPTPVMTPSYTNRDKHRLVGFEEEEESSAAMKATLEVVAEEAKALERLEVIAEEAKAVSQAMDMAVLRRPSDAEFAAIAADAKVVSQALANAALGATLASKAVSEASGIGGTAAADVIDVMQLPSALEESSAPSKRPSTAEIASLAADAEAFSQALEEAASKRPSTADIASLATDAKAVSQALASVVFSASSKSGASGAASEPFNLGWSFAGTETADAIDVSMLPEDEAPLSLHFHELDFKKVDHTAFRDELLDGFRSLGYPEEKVTKLHVTLREGSVIADIRGPLDCLQHLKAMPMNSLQVMGSWAVVRMPGMEELGLPETSQKRSLTGISGISDDSKAGSYVEENMASAIVTGFMRTTSPQASPQELRLPEKSQQRSLTGISRISDDSKAGSYVEENMASAIVGRPRSTLGHSCQCCCCEGHVLKRAAVVANLSQCRCSRSCVICRKLLRCAWLFALGVVCILQFRGIYRLYVLWFSCLLRRVAASTSFILAAMLGSSYILLRTRLCVSTRNSRRDAKQSASPPLQLNGITSIPVPATCSETTAYHSRITLLTGYQPYPAGIGNLAWVSAFPLTVTDEGPVSQLTPTPVQRRLHQPQLRLRPGRLALRRPGDSGSSQSQPWCDSFSADDSGQPTGSASNAAHRRTSGRG
ncbi:unnamed protein product [Polarella glacialis]|uniref:Uncharacterized protein n=1 Tax=Polarella glacialis TaxID=89957 RepID=A0A813LK41_POLGL|nr:unnamed protein product [Polarella glacialis]